MRFGAQSENNNVVTKSDRLGLFIIRFSLLTVVLVVALLLSDRPGLAILPIALLAGIVISSIYLVERDEGKHGN